MWPFGSSEETPDSKWATRVRGVFHSIGRRLLLGPLVFLMNLTAPIPRLGERIWHAFAIRAIYGYHRASGGDRLGLETLPSGKVRLTPVKWKGIEACDEDEKPGWKAAGRDKTWKPTTLGQSGPRLWKTPVIPLDAESWRATSILESRVAEAVDQGDMRPLYRVDEADLTATLDTRGAAGQPAVADGGAAVANVEFEPRSSPIFDDMIIDLGSEDYDGQAVSFSKAKELMMETTTTEEMDAQEQRGFLAGRSMKDLKKWMWKIMLWAGVIAIAGLIGKELVAVIFGGGDGGSVVPLLLGVLV